MLQYPWKRGIRMHKRHSLVWVSLLIAAIASFLIFRSISTKMKPLIEILATSKAVNLISVAISEEVDLAMAEDDWSYGDFISVETDESGHITMLSLRVSDGSRFKRLVTERLVVRLESIEPDTLAVPMGNLTNMVQFSALGPSIRVRVQSVGDIQTSFSNEFTSSGVNQTRHSVYLQIHVTVYLLIPGEVIPVSVQEQICVAETVIVGNVPDTYLNLKNGAD